MLQIHVCYLLHEIEETRLFRFAIHHRIAINSPCLSTCPHAVIVISLMGDSLDKLARQGIIYSHVIRCIVGTEMIFHRGIGVGHRHIIQLFIASVLCRPKQHLQVYHIVHYGVMPTKHGYITGPRKHGTHLRIEQCRKGFGTAQDSLPIRFITCQAVAVPITAKHQESQIVVVCRLIGEIF